MRSIRLALTTLFVASAALLATACSGEDGSSCSVTANADGSATVRCDDGTSVTLPPGTPGTPGTPGSSCTVTDNPDGTKTIACEDGTTVTVNNGTAGTSCTVADNGDGTKTITCEDGTRVTVRDGQNAASALITDRHGEDFMQSTGEYANGKYIANAVITSATADAAGVVTVNFSVSRAGGTAVTDIAAVTANIAKLTVTPIPAPGSGNRTKWEPYIYRTETVSGTGFPNPAGTQAPQAYREGNGTLTNHGDGTYTYRFATNISNIVVAGNPVTYERGKKHRVSVMMGGHAGATATAVFDFVPDGTTVTTTRDIVRTSACKQCHGADFHGHGGDRLSVDNCVTCHAPGSNDAQGGQTLDFKVMIHKIHAGGELPTVAGPDGNPWATADNGEYAIWGFGNAKLEWHKVGFPAQVNNCTKCHDGTGADSDVWKTTPGAEACGSCHDNVNFVTGANHEPGAEPDNACQVCHPATGSLVPLERVHDRTTTDVNAPLFDARNVPEFTFDLSMTPPANGTDYRGNEAPVVSIVIKRNGTPINHLIQSGTAQGCKHTVSPVLCDADTDGRFASAGFFVVGPRGRAQPQLTTAARAQIFSATTGPWDLSAAGANLVLKVDQGVAVTLADDWGTRLSGVITVPVTAATCASLAACTTAELVTWLNANAAFTARAIAWSEAGKLAIRSRNLGKVRGIQLQASVVATNVFAGDLAVKMPSGSTASNQLTSTTDAKVTRFSDHIEYALDPVTDAPAGTYVIDLEIGQLGRVSATDYVTPSVKKFNFKVKTATEEKQVANNCDSCHQTTAGTAGDFDGFILDPSRHNKLFDQTAIDQCVACHDYLPQSATDSTGLGAWTGAKPISRRVHAIHFGSSLNYPLRTVDYSNGDPTTGRNWDITFPQDVRNCQACHVDGDTSGTWASEPSRLPCSGCHDSDAAMTHMKLNTDDPTPADPWSGDENEACKTCH